MHALQIRSYEKNTIALSIQLGFQAPWSLAQIYFVAILTWCVIHNVAINFSWSFGFDHLQKLPWRHHYLKFLPILQKDFGRRVCFKIFCLLYVSDNCLFLSALRISILQTKCLKSVPFFKRYIPNIINCFLKTEIEKILNMNSIQFTAGKNVIEIYHFECFVDTYSVTAK